MDKSVFDTPAILDISKLLGFGKKPNPTGNTPIDTRKLYDKKFLSDWDKRMKEANASVKNPVKKIEEPDMPPETEDPFQGIDENDPKNYGLNENKLPKAPKLDIKTKVHDLVESDKAAKVLKIKQQEEAKNKSQSELNTEMEKERSKRQALGIIPKDKAIQNVAKEAIAKKNKNVYDIPERRLSEGSPKKAARKEAAREAVTQAKEVKLQEHLRNKPEPKVTNPLEEDEKRGIEVNRASVPLKTARRAVDTLERDSIETPEDGEDIDVSAHGEKSPLPAKRQEQTKKNEAAKKQNTLGADRNIFLDRLGNLKQNLKDKKEPDYLEEAAAKPQKTREFDEPVANTETKKPWQEQYNVTQAKPTKLENIKNRSYLDNQPYELEHKPSGISTKAILRNGKYEVTAYRNGKPIARTRYDTERNMDYGLQDYYKALNEKRGQKQMVAASIDKLLVMDKINELLNKGL